MNGQTFVKIAKRIFRITPFPVICGLGDGIGRLLFYLMKERTAIGLSNLKRAFPEKPEQERRRILKTFWRNFCKDMLEAIKYFATPSAIMSQRVTLVGKEHLDSLVAQKQGIVLLSAHLGNFPILCMKLGMEGYPIAVLYSEMHNRLFNPVIPLMMRSTGIEPISDRPRHACVGKSMSWLKKGGLLFLQIDQSPPTDAGLPVDFFGWETPTSRGPVSMAMRTDANILPVFIVREKNNHHRIIIDKPFPLKREGDSNRDVLLNLAALSKITEDFIRQYPAHWWWFHRRFKKVINE